MTTAPKGNRLKLSHLGNPIYLGNTIEALTVIAQHRDRLLIEDALHWKLKSDSVFHT